MIGQTDRLKNRLTSAPQSGNLLSTDPAWQICAPARQAQLLSCPEASGPAGAAAGRRAPLVPACVSLKSNIDAPPAMLTLITSALASSWMTGGGSGKSGRVRRPERRGYLTLIRLSLIRLSLDSFIILGKLSELFVT